MKLPFQAVAVLRETLSGSVGRSSRYGDPVPAVEPSDCKTCGHGPNPCKGSAPNLVSCTSGACQCCPNTTYHQDPGGACVCD
jgi:hypothetical protein